MFQKMPMAILLLFISIILLSSCDDGDNNPAQAVLKNSPPQFLMEYEDTNVVVGKAINLQVLVKDNDNDSVKVSAIAVPSGAVFDTVNKVLSWRPEISNSVIGKHSVIFLATDKIDTTRDTVFITVKAGYVPVFTCKDTVKANAGYTMNFQLTATDKDKDILKYFKRTIFDTTVKIDSLSGVLKWTPSVSLVNTQKICTLYVSDGLSEDTLILNILLFPPSRIQVPVTFSTIQGAIDAAKSGDTIIVDTGVYYENISYKGKMLVLASRFLDSQDTTMINKTIINGQDKAPVVIIGNSEPAGTRLCGFTLTNGRGNGNQGGGVHINKSPVLIDNCIIKDSKSEGG